MNTATQIYKTVSLQHERDQLILGHLSYVRHILGKLVAEMPPGVAVENLESAGVLGLVQAARQFDASRQVAFKTYAYPRIRGAIVDELRRNSPLPQRILEQISKVRRACEVLSPPVSPEAIGSETGLSIAEVEKCLEAMKLARIDIWDDSIDILGQVQDRRDVNPGSKLEAAESRRALADCIEKLPEQERLVLSLYHLEDLRLKEIGNAMRLSESRVSRILAKAEFRLKQFMNVR